MSGLCLRLAIVSEMPGLGGMPPCCSALHCKHSDTGRGTLAGTTHLGGHKQKDKENTTVPPCPLPCGLGRDVPEVCGLCGVAEVSAAAAGQRTLREEVHVGEKVGEVLWTEGLAWGLAWRQGRGCYLRKLQTLAATWTLCRVTGLREARASWWVIPKSVSFILKAVAAPGGFCMNESLTGLLERSFQQKERWTLRVKYRRKRPAGGAGCRG